MLRSGMVAGVCSAMLLACGAGLAADAAAGKKMAAMKCRTCHGLDGVATMPIAPHLAGENEIYLQTQLKAYRSGKRVNEMMSVVAKSLTDEQIANLAAWYSSIEFTVTMPE